ncbi:MAG: HDIG domain-containing protein [Phycisphaerae bacterium]|nr:MAG: HDIG domain-containing protein [Planctomycetia bacterium]RIK67372.1 MAG: HAD family hydrolase [Planctomycetota bacterium]GJQ27553.1 MAG: HDIG domain-containing protein [Phycisphaerae bacterium]
MNRPDAWKLVCEYVASDSLRRHMLAVEAAMRHYAGLLGGDADLWGIVGLLHDFDYERWPQPPDHTREGAKILRERGVDEEVVGAILSHADWNLDAYPRDRPLRKALFAVDELCGFITAAALVRPTRLAGMEPSSIKKKLKTPAFAAAVSREDIAAGADLLGIPLDEHIRNCIAALSSVASELGLAVS